MADRRAFILENTRLQRLPCLPELRLYLADEIEPLWRTVEKMGAALPYWAFAWVGGQGLARYLLDHPHEVAGSRVLDLAAGTGLCAIAALKAGASQALAADVDPFCEQAVALNAGANGVSVAFAGGDLLAAEPPDFDLIVAGDVCYERAMAARVLAWLQTAHDRGIHVLIGDPGRPYFPREALVQLAEYRVPAMRELEDSVVKRVGVFTFPATSEHDDGRVG
jgi:predicted nicotinamide N-methyase